MAVMTADDVKKETTEALANATVPEGVTIPEDIAAVTDYYGKAESALAKLEESNQAFLSGEIPKDVQDVITRLNAEQGIAQGFGVGGMTQKRTARDFGLTSMDLIKQGQAQQAAIVSGYQTLGNAREAMREYNSSFRQSGQQLLAQQQSFGLDSAKLMQAQDQFQANLTMQANEALINLATYREGLLRDYTSMDKREQFADSAAALDDLINNLSNVLQGI